MARKTVRVDIPSSKPDDLLDLADTFSEQGQKAGDTMKTEVDWANFDQRRTDARKLRRDAEQLDAQAQTKRQAASALLGLAPEQNSETPGTTLHDLTGGRDLLLVRNRGNEQALERYGFPVVVGTSSPGRKKKDPGGKTA